MGRKSLHRSEGLPAREGNVLNRGVELQISGPGCHVSGNLRGYIVGSGIVDAGEGNETARIFRLRACLSSPNVR